MALGDRLKELRNNKTQQEIADKIGISRARYSHYENGRSEPDNEMLSKLADLYEVTVDELLGRNGDDRYIAKLEVISEAIEHLEKKRFSNKISDFETVLYNEFLEELKEAENGTVNIETFIKAQDYLQNVNKENKDIAKRLKEFEAELENSDGLAFDGEPMSDEAKESLLESMELLFRQTQRINKKYTPKKYREDD